MEALSADVSSSPGQAVAKTLTGNYFEDFYLGQQLRHATPRTLTEGDVALYTALYGSRFVLGSSDQFAQDLGLPCAPVDDVLVFHIVFGKTVPDVSVNAVANLGYAEGKFQAPVFPGDTLSAHSEVIGLKENSNGKTGTVYVRSFGTNQRGETVLDYIRWVMVNKRDPASPPPQAVVPRLATNVSPAEISVPEGLLMDSYDCGLAGSGFLWDDYRPGECIDHVDGVTLEESDHMTATRLYQNTAKVHFDALAQKDSRFGRRLIYGGHIISMARAVSFNGLANAFRVVAIHGGRHVAPAFAGDTIYAWSRIESVDEVPGRTDIGQLRVRTFATKDRGCADFPGQNNDGKYEDGVILDFDYSVLMPRRGI